MEEIFVPFEYEARYPHLIKPIYQVENQYSKGNVVFCIKNPSRH